MIQNRYSIHLVGIGGSGMSGIAEILLRLGHRVSGSDIAENKAVVHLKKLGASVTIGHCPENIRDQDAVVYSTAISPTNPELLTARKRGIPLLHRSEMLFELTRMRRTVAVGGTHGKTTTTSILGMVLTEGGYDPTVVVGGIVHHFGTSARFGESNLMVVEADESDGSFLKLNPEVAVVTNIDEDHLDFYRDREHIESMFRRFMDSVPFYGFVAACGDDPSIGKIVPELNRRVVTYGMSERGNEYRASVISGDVAGTLFTVARGGETLGEVRVNVPGTQYVLNSLAAISVALELGVTWEAAVSAVASYTGVERRFQVVGDAGGVKVIDDYAHHPTEIRFTGESARKLTGGKVVAVFQPHRFSRTRKLYREFAAALEEVFDHTVLLDVYPAGEDPIPGVDSRLIAGEFSDESSLTLCGEIERVPGILESIVRQGDVILCLGAGNISTLPPKLVAFLGRRKIAEARP